MNFFFHEDHACLLSILALVFKTTNIQTIVLENAKVQESTQMGKNRTRGLGDVDVCRSRRGGFATIKNPSSEPFQVLRARFTPLYTFLYDNLDEFAVGHIGPVILIIAESQFRDVSVVDKEINVMSMFVNLIKEL